MRRKNIAVVGMLLVTCLSSVGCGQKKDKQESLAATKTSAFETASEKQTEEKTEKETIKETSKETVKETETETEKETESKTEAIQRRQFLNLMNWQMVSTLPILTLTAVCSM